MAITHIIPEGTTEPQDFQLLADKINLLDPSLDLTLGLKIDDKNGLAVTLVGTFAYLDQADGTVRVLLHPTDLPLNLSPYTVRWTITDSAGRIAFIPNGVSADRWQIIAVP